MEVAEVVRPACGLGDDVVNLGGAGDATVAKAWLAEVLVSGEGCGSGSLPC